jgi:hypothetical protein
MVDGLATYRPLAGLPMTQRSKVLRFAVGGFEDWHQSQKALCDASKRGHLLNSFNCLALKRLFASKPILAASHQPEVIRPIPFPGSEDQIACTNGPLADLLTKRVRCGARTLEEALDRWLIPRHAAELEGAVLAGKILYWISLADAEDEHRAYQTLFAHSSTSIGVHDFDLTAE